MAVISHRARNGHAEIRMNPMTGERNRDYARDQAFRGGAGDENRTRTISLGSGAITAAHGADLREKVAARDRGCPLVTLANGPLMAQRSCTDLRQPGAVRAALSALLLPRPPRSCR